MEQVIAYLNGLVSGALTVPLVMWFLTFAVARGWMWAATDAAKNIAAFVVPFVLAALGEAGLIYFGVVTLPDPTVVAWLNFVVPIFGMAYTTSQALYKGLFKPALAKAASVYRIAENAKTDKSKS